MNLLKSKIKATIQLVACLAIIATISITFFYPDVIEGNILQQPDILQGVSVGQEGKSFYEQTGETSRWTNSLFSGMPTFQINPTYPSNKLFRWINTIMGLGLPAPSNLIAMMMIGFLILLLSLKMRYWIALLGAIAYGLSSYYIILIGAGHIWKFVTLAYIPPTIAGIILCYKRHYLFGASITALFGMMQIANNHFQMTYYFIFVVLGFIISFLLYAIKHNCTKQWFLSSLFITISAIFAISANLPNLYGTYEYSKETIRGRYSDLSSNNNKQPSGLQKDYITQYSYQPSETFTLLIPNIKGGASVKPVDGKMEFMDLTNLKEAENIDPITQQYLVNVPQYFGDPEGTNGPVYVGAFIVALFILGCIIIKNPIKWILLSLTIFSIILSWGKHAMLFTDIMLYSIPFYSKFRAVESILVIAQFTMPLLAILALSKIIYTKNSLCLYKRPLFLSFGITFGICAIVYIFPNILGSSITEQDYMVDKYISTALINQGYDTQTIKTFSLSNPYISSTIESLRYGLVRSDALRSLFIVFITFVILLLYMKEKLNLSITASSLVIITIIDLYSVDKRYIDHNSFIKYDSITETPIEKTKADSIILKDSFMNYRVMDIPRFFSAAPSYYHKMIGGYHAAKLTRYQDIIDQHLVNFINGNPNHSDSTILNMLNARYIVDNKGNVTYNKNALGNAWIISDIDYVMTPNEEMSALSNIDIRNKAVADKKYHTSLGEISTKSQGDTIYETLYAPNNLVYKSKSKTGGIAVFSEIYFPWGWKAYINGKETEIGRVNYLLRAIRIPAGETIIDMRFNPSILKTTDTIATIAIILIYISLLISISLIFFRDNSLLTKHRDMV
jgi:hypothetical protein